MHVLMCAFVFLFASAAWGGDAIPKAAWKGVPWDFHSAIPESRALPEILNDG